MSSIVEQAFQDLIHEWEAEAESYYNQYINDGYDFPSEVTSTPRGWVDPSPNLNAFTHTYMSAKFKILEEYKDMAFPNIYDDALNATSLGWVKEAISIKADLEGPVWNAMEDHNRDLYNNSQGRDVVSQNIQDFVSSNAGDWFIDNQAIADAVRDKLISGDLITNLGDDRRCVELEFFRKITGNDKFVNWDVNTEWDEYKLNINSFSSTPWKSNNKINIPTSSHSPVDYSPLVQQAHAVAKGEAVQIIDTPIPEGANIPLPASGGSPTAPDIHYSYTAQPGGGGFWNNLWNFIKDLVIEDLTYINNDADWGQEYQNELDSQKVTDDLKYETGNAYGKICTNGVDPLVIDLDQDGVELTDINETPVYFDYSGDGFAERTGWVAPNDGLLAIDKNSNGTIDNLTELFGSEEKTGFEELAELDSNSDGVIDSNDTEFANLKVWQDLDSDGITDDGELKTLEEVGI